MRATPSAVYFARDGQQATMELGEATPQCDRTIDGADGHRQIRWHIGG